MRPPSVPEVAPPPGHNSLARDTDARSFVKNISYDFRINCVLVFLWDQMLSMEHLFNRMYHSHAFENYIETLSFLPGLPNLRSLSKKRPKTSYRSVFKLR